jgi:hypothetical protein
MLKVVFSYTLLVAQTMRSRELRVNLIVTIGLWKIVRAVEKFTDVVAGANGNHCSVRDAKPHFSGPLHDSSVLDQNVMTPL